MARIAKTVRDILREDVAQKINARLLGTGMNVIAGGGSGPYTLIIKRLSRKKLKTLLDLIETFQEASHD